MTSAVLPLQVLLAEAGAVAGSDSESESESSSEVVVVAGLFTVFACVS